MQKNIFKFGNSSLALVVPKKWTEKNGIKAGSSVTVGEDNKGSLVLSTGGAAELEGSKTVDKSTDPYFIWKWVGLYYRFGINKLEIISRDGFSPKQIEAVKDQIEQYSPGFEIMSQTNKQIIIEDLTKQKDMDLDKMVSRMRSLVIESFREITSNEFDSMPSTEALLNRFYQLCLRYINIVQPKNMLKYFRVVESMEEIGDLLLKMATKEGCGSKAINALLARAQEAFLLSDKALAGDENSLTSIYNTEKEIQSNKRKTETAECYELVQEVMKYIAYIAEFGLAAEKEKVVY